MLQKSKTVVVSKEVLQGDFFEANLNELPFVDILKDLLFIHAQTSFLNMTEHFA
jgi:hypothetical protein